MRWRPSPSRLSRMFFKIVLPRGPGVRTLASTCAGLGMVLLGQRALVADDGRWGRRWAPMIKDAGIFCNGVRGAAAAAWIPQHHITGLAGAEHDIIRSSARAAALGYWPVING